MKSLFIVTAAFEAATGLALLGLPTAVASLLLGGALDTPAAVVVARMTGAALLALGVACWRARNDGESRGAVGLAAAMTLYNVAAVAVLANAALGTGLSGVALWPAIFLHAALAAWCVACLRARS